MASGPATITEFASVPATPLATTARMRRTMSIALIREPCLLDQERFSRADGRLN